MYYPCVVWPVCGVAHVWCGPCVVWPLCGVARVWQLWPCVKCVVWLMSEPCTVVASAWPLFGLSACPPQALRHSGAGPPHGVDDCHDLVPLME
jgi:hypothetical protein